ncbi:N-acetyltransferase [Pseudoflavonifractor sp. 60]|uniref:GNAT family N-acetyltransferase n=1 Tax=Pseudoflavonifractor sp. 60 TaxID=2304576 RepID=UPI0013716F93|nr:N-acetyltransferase [Pseudoflavonifractor sp. 60]NBI67855.1 N-acetyltransferase [Pseudoflavonifractor sp. 60]
MSLMNWPSPASLPDTIRPVREEDFPAVYELVKTAFQTARVSDGTEQDFVEQLRRREGFSLELAAEREGALTGHVMLTETEVPCPPGQDPKEWKFLMLAPLSVRLEDRGRGLGGALIGAAVQRTEANAIFLVGDPGYYGRYGFENAVEFGFTNASGVPDQYLLVLPLESTLRDRARGPVNLH